jgi:sodium/hydrogen antiporter
MTLLAIFIALLFLYSLVSGRLEQTIGVLVAREWPQFTLAHALYAALSLPVVRMLPVAISLVGTRLSWATVLFMGWFGPRGLASIVLVLVYLELGNDQPAVNTIRLTVMVTVLLSIFAHGLTARLGTEIYARSLATVEPRAPELEETGTKSAGWTTGRT